MLTASFLFILIFGTLGHFIFEWSGHRHWAAIFFAVNESTWEHIKLSIYPSFLWAIIYVALRGWSVSILTALAAAQLIMIFLIPALFYSYTAITHKNWLITDIICFVIAVFAGASAFCTLAEMQFGMVMTVCSVIVLAVVSFMYFTFSLHAPHFFIFRDPISGGYGPTGHGCKEHFHEGVDHNDCGCHPHQHHSN